MNTVATEVAVEPTLDGSEGELTAAICIELDVAGSREVDELCIPEFQTRDPPLAEQWVLLCCSWLARLRGAWEGDEVVGGHGEGELPIDFWQPARARLAQPGDGLGPPKASAIRFRFAG